MSPEPHVKTFTPAFVRVQAYNENNVVDMARHGDTAGRCRYLGHAFVRHCAFRRVGVPLGSPAAHEYGHEADAEDEKSRHGDDNNGGHRGRTTP